MPDVMPGPSAYDIAQMQAAQHAGDALVEAYLRRKEMEDASARLLAQQKFQADLAQRESQWRLQNELAAKKYDEDRAARDLANRNEAIKGTAKRLSTLRTNLDTLNAQDDQNRAQLAKKYAEGQVVSMLPQLGAARAAAPARTLPEIIAASALSQSDKARAQAAYDDAYMRVLADPKFGRSDTLEAKRRDLQYAIDRSEQEILEHVKRGGTTPAMDEDLLAPIQAQTRSPVPPLKTASNSSEKTGPPPPAAQATSQAATQFPGLLSLPAAGIAAAAKAIGSTVAPVASSAFQNAKTLLTGGNWRGLNDTFTPAQQEAISQLTPGNELGDAPGYFVPPPASGPEGQPVENPGAAIMRLKAAQELLNPYRAPANPWSVPYQPSANIQPIPPRAAAPAQAVASDELGPVYGPSYIDSFNPGYFSPVTQNPFPRPATPAPPIPPVMPDAESTLVTPEMVRALQILQQRGYVH